MNLYFRDNFFNTGLTEILNDQEENIGYLDLKSTFRSSVDVYGQSNQLICSGKFPFLSAKWQVINEKGELMGVLRNRLSFLTKKFIYESVERGIYEITSPAFSKKYEICDESGALAAGFEQINGWFSPGAFLLKNDSEYLNSNELIAVIMGMYNIQKRQQVAAAN
ncbi:hypothetical protein MJA45_24800 [Paenibacillus aurantius]|uniref:Uncharacterized protein n=1 Tax=Paenibacillus aurantius TaxID=2918900 RepID=A0AA96LEU5_9BACL|nr:hypothetical protein [Paenibacillus aurantius]WNQ10801.1 hypothetical protein MJA45_24800 [Paenibacillus aurantius]